MTDLSIVLALIISITVSIFFFIRLGEQLEREAKARREESEQLRKPRELRIFAQEAPNAETRPADQAADLCA